MSGERRFPIPSLSRSIDVHVPDFTGELMLDGTTVNMTSGIQEGIGPRYGFAPLAGHMDEETPAAGHFPGMMEYEVTSSAYTGGDIFRRQNIFAIFPLLLRQAGEVGDINMSSTFYAYVVSYTSNLAFASFDVLLGATYPSTHIVQASDITAGLQFVGADTLSGQITSGAPSLIGEKLLVPQANNTTITNYVTGAGGQRDVLFTLQKNQTGRPYLSATPFSVSGPDVAMKWLIGEKTVQPDATHAPSLGFAYFTSLATSNPAILCGIPSTFNYRNFPQTTRDWSMFTIAALDDGGIYYSARHQATAAIVKANYNETEGQTAFDSFVFTWTRTGGTNYAAVEAGLLNDEAMTGNSSYRGVAIAGGKPILVLYQDWYRAYVGEMQQYVDPTNMPQPDVFPFFFGGGADFGAANTGILRANTWYEFGVSIYDKRLNYETNVAFIKAAQAGVNDFVNYTLWAGGGGGAGSKATIYSNTTSLPISPIKPPNLGNVGYNSTTGHVASQPAHLNYLEYRFYYRQQGMTEWLPALFVDAAKYWFYPLYTASTPLALCVGAIGGLPGGYAGGFNDYTQLPQDTYNCTVMYKNRLFWFSEKALAFSLLNNVFAYPGRNTAACPVGAFKGALVQAYYGQADQDARIVVFGTKATYVGKFTGNLLQVPVTLDIGPPDGSPVIANFGLDGSDFVLNAWTSVTAFSYRSAVVAEGILYFWGPQGVFMDDGVSAIQRISLPLEPDLFGLYDASQTDAVTCVYNDTTKEITWFFAPKTPDATYPTYGIVWNRAKNSWLYVKYRGQVDAAQVLTTDTTAVPTCGTRTVIYSRQSPSSTLQRAYYYDQNNRAGDIFPTQELMVKSFTTPSAGVRRFTLATGYDAGAFATIAAGDLICAQQVARYATSLATPNDFIGTVAAVGAGTIDVTLPPGLVFDASATLASNALFFPLYHAKPAANGINGFPYLLSSKYWVPGGMGYWAYWLYFHFLIKVNQLLPSVAAQIIKWAYRAPLSTGYIADTLTLTNNSDGNCQIYHPNTVGNMNAEGQGIRMQLSGIQIGSAWVLQYLEAYAKDLPGDQLRTFEG